MKKWHKLSLIIITSVLIASMLAPAAFLRQETHSRAHPLLAQLASEDPDQMLVVIIQPQTNLANVEMMVDQLGGVVTKNISMINAIAATLSAQSALTLADNPNIRWVSLDAPVEKSKRRPINDNESIDPVPQNYFLDSLGVRSLWDMGLQGQGISVAVIDSGITPEKDLQVDPTKGKPDSRVIEQLTFNSNSGHVNDATGHGTHIAGIIGGSGYMSGGLYAGIAPQVNFISLKISDDTGMAYESDAIAAMQWILDNKDRYNIRVVNLSINSTQESSYHSSPLDAAAEILWFNGVVVVASVGNKGKSDGYNTANAAPANDPFIITVGASDEHDTPFVSDDTVSTFSAHGRTVDGFTKPEIIAPGTDIVSILGPGNWISEHPDNVVMNGEYFRLSGTSMAAPMVTGAVVLLLQDEPNLTPDQVKYRLIGSAGVIGGGNPYLDVYAAVTDTSAESANTGLVASQLLWTGDDPVAWDSVAWNSVAWNSVAWNSVAWNSVAWNSVAWNSVAWNSISFSSIAWNGPSRDLMEPFVGIHLFYWRWIAHQKNNSYKYY
jgi:serine protease AprX